jgi:hypothetical protein
LLTVAALVVASPAARADRAAPIAQPIERALRVPVVVVGKITAIEKDPVEATLYPGVPNKVAYRIALVKVESNLLGADGSTHLRVGFIPAAAGLRRGPENPNLAEGQEWLFFLTKHHDGPFHAIPYMTPPLDAKAEDYKAQVEGVKKVMAAVADPIKSLKAAKAEDRFQAAVALVTKHRTTPEGVREVEQVALPADESALILKALAEGDWKAKGRADRLNGLSAFYSLALTEKDGWKPPAPVPGGDFTEQLRQSFTKWLYGPGKDYRVKKLVPKRVEK